MQKVRTPNKCVFALAETHLPGGWGGLILQGVVVVDVVTFRPNWARTLKISLKATYWVCERQKWEFPWKSEKSLNFEHFTAP